MRRREFIRLLGGGTFLTQPSFVSLAQGTRSRPLIAILALNGASSVSPRLRGFLKTMKDIGYVEGRDFILVERYADGQLDRLPILADELVRLSPSLFVTGSVPATFAAKRASETTPIVCIALEDPIGLGLVASEARPGGQVTGILDTVDGLTGKQLALAAELLPGASRVGVLINGRNQGHSVQRQGAEAAARMLAVSLTFEDVHSPKEIDEALQSFMHQGIQMLLVLMDPIFVREAQRIAALVAGIHLPTMYTIREFVDAGGLMSYGVSVSGNWRRAAFYVDKIFNGTKPGDLLVELPTKFELVINLKAAKALALTIPETLLATADEVIQ